MEIIMQTEEPDFEMNGQNYFLSNLTLKEIHYLHSERRLKRQLMEARGGAFKLMWEYITPDGKPANLMICDKCGLPLVHPSHHKNKGNAKRHFVGGPNRRVSACPYYKRETNQVEWLALLKKIHPKFFITPQSTEVVEVEETVPEDETSQQVNIEENDELPVGSVSPSLSSETLPVSTSSPVLVPTNGGRRKKGGGSKKSKGPNKYAKYLEDKASVMDSFTNLKGLIKILDYLDTRDVIAIRQTNQLLYRITNTTPLWKRLCFRGLPILDWSHLSTKIIGPNLVTVLDFEGVKVPNLTSPEAGTRAEKLTSFWRNFEQLHHHLGSVEVMKFGTLPLFVLQELSGLTKEGQPFRKLKVLSVGNVVSSGDTEAPVTLEEMFPLIEMFREVEVLKIAAKSGLVMSREEGAQEEATEKSGDQPQKPKKKNRKQILSTIGTTLRLFENLISLSLPSLSGLSATEYSKLLGALKYDQLKSLELGSAENWCRKSLTDSEEREWSSPMELLANCGEVTSLKLVEVKVDEHAALVAGLFESIILVEKLSFEKIKVEDSGFRPWTTLTARFQTLPLSELHFTTNDPFTNRALFESARDLVATQRRPLSLTWTVTVNVDDQGHAFVPLSLGTFTATPNLDFVERYLSVLDTPQEFYQVDEQSVAVEIETLSELMNRDINLNAWSGEREPMVKVAIVPQ